MIETQRRIWMQMIRWIEDLTQDKMSFQHFISNMKTALTAVDSPEFDAVRVFYHLWKPLSSTLEDPFRSKDIHAARVRSQIEKLDLLLVERQKLWKISDSFHHSPKTTVLKGGVP